MIGFFKPANWTKENIKREVKERMTFDSALHLYYIGMGVVIYWTVTHNIEQIWRNTGLVLAQFFVCKGIYGICRNKVKFKAEQALKVQARVEEKIVAQEQQEVAISQPDMFRR